MSVVWEAATEDFRKNAQMSVETENGLLYEGLYEKKFIYCLILKYFFKYSGKLSKDTSNWKISIRQFPHTGKISQ